MHDIYVDQWLPTVVLAAAPASAIMATFCMQTAHSFSGRVPLCINEL